ncbi:MAG: type IV secretion system DNA-binding domain-containing protein [Bdellovibrionales bacterium]|nr:type IV secretion system DNA-binding domain-containing protein [Bdellovibrionales bacterium]
MPLPLAVVGLAVVLGALFYFQNPAGVTAELARWDRYFDAHMGFATAVLCAGTLNVIWLWSVLSRSLELTGQGQKLGLLASARLSREGRKSSLRLAHAVWPLCIGGAACFAFFFLLPKAGVLPWWLSAEIKQIVCWTLAGNFAISVAILSYLTARSEVLSSFATSRKVKALPPVPKLENGIVVGSVGEDTDEPSWLSLSEYALRGNILITGSIGSGKTQGTILRYAEQIVANFKLRPSMLFLDPKSTFIREVVKLFGRLGLVSDMLHVKLGGDVTYNPIFEPRALKGARFANTAHMIRAAASNFIASDGRNHDFWDVQSYNLIRACLAFCAALKPDYYTLHDLMTALVQAGNEESLDRLKATLKEEQFDEEERFNIASAVEYFEDEYAKLADKVRTSILATATNFLNQFREYQAGKIFCPPKDKLTIQSMDEVVDQGKILLFDVTSQALARSMGTLVKLRYQQSVLDLLSRPDERGPMRGAVLVMDEYQDVVTVGTGAVIGDDRYLAKAREAGGITIAASQSLSSIENAVGSQKAASELFQNFRTCIAGHSADLKTVRIYQELAGQKDVERASHSVSETSQGPNLNLVLGGFEAKEANLSESINVTEHRESIVTAADFFKLKTFECFGLIYDGVATSFRRLWLKPYYLEEKNLLQEEVLATLPAQKALLAQAACLLLALVGTASHAFPSVCSVVKSAEFTSCLGLKVGACMCGWPTPRPCAKFSYYVPQTFVEVMPDSGSTHFGALPGAAAQMASVSGGLIPYGTEGDIDTQSFHSHTVAVPFASIPFALLPCGGTRIERSCFDGMSEHVGSSWSSGSGDLLQPQFLAWAASPKACLLKGALMSSTGGELSYSPETPACSVPLGVLPKFPPSQHSACNGWGIFYPRTGVYNGGSQTAGALMVASRMKSLSSELFRSTPASTDELWQMVSPQSSSCFKEGQNVGLLETVKGVREERRLLGGKLRGYLFTVWSKVSCCRDLAEVPKVMAALGVLIGACAGIPE